MRVGIVIGFVSLLVLSAGPVSAQTNQQSQSPVQSQPPVQSQSQTQNQSSTVTVETLQQANQKIRQLAQSAQANEVGEYPLGAGDLIRVDVFDIPELSQQIRIDPGGYITMPLIPQRIRASGLTPSQLESKIADLLRSRGLVSHPQVTVFVVQRMSQPITVIGAVMHPMIYQAVRPTTLLEVLSAAGGLKNTAADYVTISRANKNGTSHVQRVSLRDLIDHGDPTANVMLRGGDVITVPKAGIVYVVGAVVRPGGFVIQNDTGQMTALKALALAGGTGPAARTKEAVIIRKKKTTGKSQEIRVNLKNILDRKAEDVQLRPNDILFVPRSAGKKALAKAAQAALSITSGIMIVRGGTF